MSLQIAAQHLASRGRGPDTQLVHMAPQEVAGLHALAKAHGGSLTTNPDTGLPEAGFLSSILPMVIGGALAATGIGAPLAAAMVGGGYGLATGSLSKGLMAGMGAFGGAGLAGGLMGAGTGALSSAAGSTAANALTPVTAVAPEAIIPAATEGAVGATQTLGATAVNPTGIPGFAGSNIGLTPPASTINAASVVPQATPTITQAPVLTQQAADIGNIYAQEQAAQNAVGTALKSNTGFSAGLSELGKDPSRFMTMQNAKYGLAALSPVIADALAPKAPPKPKEYKPIDYDFSYNQVEDPQAGYTGAYTGERRYFNPTFTERPTTAAGGGLMDIGPVEAMSNRNQAAAMMANGGIGFADGGDTTKAVQPVEQNPYYTMNGQSGDAFKYLMGQMPAPSQAPAPAPAVAAPVVAAQPAAKSDLTPFQQALSGIKKGSLSGDPFASAASMVGGKLKGRGSDAGEYSYSFDPASGLFTQLAAPTPEYDVPVVFNPYGGEGYGNSGSAAASVGANGASGLGTGVEGFGASYAHGGIASLAQGGQSHLGDYSDGGRLLRGPGDGVSDSIPASIGDKRPARLADGEFVVPARIVSELGNGSTEAGARKLYAMMDRVQNARKKSIGKDRVAVNSRSEKMLPA